MPQTLIAEFENAFINLANKLRHKPSKLADGGRAIKTLLHVVSSEWDALVDIYAAETHRQAEDVYRVLELFKKHPECAQQVREAVMKGIR